MTTSVANVVLFMYMYLSCATEILTPMVGNSGLPNNVASVAMVRDVQCVCSLPVACRSWDQVVR